jgi:4-hydroxybenzoate polyprenyltransferase
VAAPHFADVVPLRGPRSRTRATIVALRPRQWSKNLLLFAGILFAAKLGDASRWVEAGAAFVAYCAASSAAYVGNDLVDAEHDRRHPVKRLRPIAARELPERTASFVAVALALLALAVGAALGPQSLLLVAAFLVAQAAYSLRLKHVVLVDVLLISALFVIRAAAGATAVDVRISPWLLLCTMLLALFLALAKRRGELVLVGAEATPGRPVLEGYSLALVDQLISVVAAATIAAYSIYTFTAHTDAMVATVPFVLFGLFRYLLLVHRRDLGEEPEELLLRDRPLLAAVAAWAIVSAAILVAS